MNVLITGGTGFVGKRLLCKIDACPELIPYVLSGRKQVEVGGKKYNTINHKNYSFNRNDFNGVEIECVVHLGATTPKGLGDDTIEGYLDNIRTTWHLFNNLPNIPKRVIFISSTSVYEATNAPINENSKLGTEDAYGLSKILCEKYILEYAQRNNTELNILRLGPVYGPGEETYNKLFGTFCKKALKGEDIVLFSDGSDKRSMVYVDAVADCIVKTVQGFNKVKIVNITSNKSISVLEAAKSIKKNCRSNSNIILKSERPSRDSLFDANLCDGLFGDILSKYDYSYGIKALCQHIKGTK